MFVNHRCQYFGSAQPPAQANELRQLFIVHLVHCLLYAVLGAIQFPAHIVPIPLVCCLNDRLRMRCNRISHTNTFRQRRDTLPNLLHGFCVFSLHGDKTIRDHCPKQEGNTWTLGEVRSLVAADMCPPVHRAQLVQRTENLVSQWHHNVFHSRGQLFNVDVLRGLSAIRTNGKTAEHNQDFKISYKRHHWHFRLLISASYSGFNGANLNRNSRCTQIMPAPISFTRSSRKSASDLSCQRPSFKSL